MLRELFEKQRCYLNHFFDRIDIQKTEKILEKVLQSEGNLFFSGVGKSGIIAQKLAVTFSSTGTRSFYLSPLDALHGDLGMLSNKDLFFLLSKSGESVELLNLLPHIKEKGADTIALVCSENSSLARQSDHYIILPLENEICPFNLAPTTSTTAQLILGDVLAIALMKKKQFKLDEYAKNHPSGMIGKKLSLKVKQLMRKDHEIPFCKPEVPLIDVLSILSGKRCGAVIVVNEEKNLLGLFTDGDLRRAIEKDAKNACEKKISVLMTKDPKWIDQETLAWDALKYMEQDKNKLIMVLPVLSEKKVVGIIHMHDLLQAGLYS